MKKTLSILMVLIVVLGANLAFAHGDFNETKELIDSEISCDKLSDEQLEEIGEYYMEQMHPGESHELMDNMMGGEDSESLKQMHIQMAKRLYCNEDTSGMMGSGGMMGMMDMMMGNNMMGGNSGMMGSNMMNNAGYGMMGNWGYGFGYWSFINILYIILLIGLIILVYLWITRLLRDSAKKKK